MQYDNWQEFIREEEQKPYFVKLRREVMSERAISTVYPPKQLLFNAYNLTPLDKVRVVIVGQDPYINDGQAMGLSFSVNNGVKLPPSLVNIFKCIKEDTGRASVVKGGDLTAWATQGVFLLNTILTVRQGQSLSHKDLGWQQFTDATIKVINQLPHRVVYLLWGNNAKSKAGFITNPNHLVLVSSHPSPLSVYCGFDTCKHFSKANEFLSADGVSIDW